MSKLIVPKSLLSAQLAGVGEDSALAKSLLLQAGLASDTLESLDGSITLAQYSHILTLLFQTLDDEAGGFLLKPMRLGSFDLMCHGLMGAEDLGAALVRLARFSRVLSEELSYRLWEFEEEVFFEINYRNEQQKQSSFFLSAIATICMRLWCWLVDQPLLLHRVEFSFEQPPFSDELEAIFSTGISYGKATTRLVMPSDYLRYPLRQNQASLKTFLEAAPLSLLTQYRKDDSFTAQLNGCMSALIESGVRFADIRFEHIASELSLPPHTLRRRLKDESQSFQSLYDNYRRRTAMAWLQNRDEPLAIIAEELGFSEPAAFHRAFKRWTGQSPSSYRKSLLSGTSSV
ncbi:AraC family transcriptional regulator [Umboniibacter marinipuniceus]|uniref:Helix-turn-helix protein n=1 Tax=Umboniibacter marinipuniceus TaxID=569599 RepID=A0A3M0A8W3_9GAMM|nr:AraC family transcriptional regulator [Umboniibacter marinipuniceus]RMA80977.1 helix-turn-helix protein [Umboniibacter marinipuniceus]